MKTLKSFLITSLILGATLFYVSRPPSLTNETYVPIDGGILIAHAGGGHEAGTYSNTKEAMDLAVANGFTYIELDFTQVKNGDWVLMHDWNKTHLRYFSPFPNFPPVLANLLNPIPETAKDFKARKMRFNLTHLTLDDTARWLEHHPNIRIITDVKGDNIEGLQAIKLALGNKTNQIIPQIYSPEEYSAVKSIGYSNIIFTAYRSSMGLNDIVEFCQSHDLFALTIPKGWLSENTLKSLSSIQTPLFTHTVNAPNNLNAYKQNGVDGFYTDYLTPISSREKSPL